ncbi:MAG: type VI secretion system tip protein VgrG, partial [Polyangiaceae bacterium]|nr:type VI secretion system tip protein VgrG [Polyangiaceae bacterium]
LSVVDGQGGARHVHGVVDETEIVPSKQGLRFRVRLVPALAALAHREDCRVFQQLSAVDVARQIFAEAGFADRVEWRLGTSYPAREYTVQYRESTLAFVSRLFEDEGIFYFFEHGPEGHTLVIADSNEAFRAPADAPPLEFWLAESALGFGEVLRDFRRSLALRPGRVRVRDDDFKRPQAKPEALASIEGAWPLGRYEYPGGFVDEHEGKRRAARRLDEARADADVCRGSSTAIGLRCGAPFRVEGARQAHLNGEYVVTELTSRGRQGAGHVGETYAFRGEFRGIPKAVAYAPARSTPRPRIRGLQTAVVTGPTAGEQSVHVDEYGRIKLRFHWDRVAPFDDTSSCWVRVAQPQLGGAIVLPRVGWEVAVAFLGGDPDRPLALGRVYNGEQAPPYGLPAAQGAGSLKSMSSPGGAGHNELKMSDDGGSQGFGIHAQKDLNVTIGNDKNERVGVDQTHNVRVNMSTSVGADDALSVAGDQSVEVGANLSCSIGGAQSITVGGSDTSNAAANFVEKIDGSRAYEIAANQFTLANGLRHEAQGDVTRSVGAVQTIVTAGDVSDVVHGDLNERVGAVKMLLVNGMVSEEVTGAKSQTYFVAELHHITGDSVSNCEASATTMVGGLHYRKVGDEFVVKSSAITLVGAIGEFKAGGSVLKLGGGPIIIKGSKITIKAPLIVKMGASLKLGS